MWASELHRYAAIRQLLRSVDQEHLWAVERKNGPGPGPTEEACDLLKAGGGTLSGGEWCVLRVAFDIWNGRGKVTVDEVLALDRERLRAVTEAMLARDAR